MITVKNILVAIGFFGMILIMNTQQAFAQDHSATVNQGTAIAINPADPAFRAQYKDLAFGDHFVLKVISDEKNNYYIVDFSKLPTRFEKVYFMNLVFKKDKIVNIDSDISQSQVWFLASESCQVSTVEELMDSLRNETVKANASFSEDQREKWLKENDKYGREAVK